MAGLSNVIGLFGFEYTSTVIIHSSFCSIEGAKHKCLSSAFHLRCSLINYWSEKLCSHSLRSHGTAMKLFFASEI